MNQVADTIIQAAIIEAINDGLDAGGNEQDWGAKAFERALILTDRAGCVWDFAGWSDALRCVELGKLGGVVFADPTTVTFHTPDDRELPRSEQFAPTEDGRRDLDAIELRASELADACHVEYVTARDEDGEIIATGEAAA